MNKRLYISIGLSVDKERMYSKTILLFTATGSKTGSLE